MAIPSEATIRKLHEKYAPSRQVFEAVFTHCNIVNAIAAQLTSGRPADINMPLVAAGCLLHDIGVYKLYDAEGKLDEGSYIRHGILGYKILKAEGFSDVICRFASHHTGVGITKYDIEHEPLDLPARDYLAEGAEERLVMYADKFHSKSTPPHFNSADSYKNYVAKFGARKVEIFNELIAEFGMPDLEALSRQFGGAVV